MQICFKYGGRFRALAGAALFLSVLLAGLGRSDAAPAESRWWRGNLHTHSFWSDGDDFPEMITAWYKDRGYHFLAISDHNVIQQSERWLAIGTNQVRRDALQKYIDRFGTNWVEMRDLEGKLEVRLKPLNEYQALFHEAERFLMISSEELTDRFGKLPVHLNASNIREHIPPQGGNSVREVMQNNVNAVLVQSRTTGQRILPHLNHPNFGWGVTAEDLAAVRGERFFEVYNGHPDVHNAGDHIHASTDRIWDIALALRLSSEEREPLYALAVDDSHHYHSFGRRFSNAGRGWIMVRSAFLTPEHLLAAMERGDFYASSGVTLKNVVRSSSGLHLEMEPEPGVEYRTEFIGLRHGFTLSSEPVKDKEGADLAVTRIYDDSIGQILAEARGNTASYSLIGDELYVRARVISTKPKEHAPVTNEFEMAWTQPIFPAPLLSMTP